MSVTETQKSKAKLSPFNSACLLVLVLLGSGCSQNSLLTRQDYQKSQQDFLRGDADGALLNFPRKAEDGTFITTMERDSVPDPEQTRSAMQKHVETRKTGALPCSASRTFLRADA